MRVLLVEDNRDLAASIIEYLSLHSCSCDVAFDGASGLHHAVRNEYDIYIFDVSMPRMDGLELCKTLRLEQKDHTPAMFLTARDTLDDKLAGFSAGADDYLVKPFELQELYVRLCAIHKRCLDNKNVLTIADLSVDLETQQVQRAGHTISLSPTSYKLLVALMQRTPNVVSRQELEYILWGEELPDSDSLRSHVYKLRAQIDKPFDQPVIHTVQGRGFRIC